jgi:hypothetical protein
MEPLSGGCLCGAVRFEVVEPPVGASYCHCTRCQRRTGTAAPPSVRVVPGSVRVVSGEDEVQVWRPPDGLGKAFCRVCGSHLFAIHPEDGTARGVRFAAFDEPPPIRPQWRQYVAYAASWETIPDDGLPRFPDARPAG